MLRQQDWADGSWGAAVVLVCEFSRRAGAPRQPKRREPYQRVCGQPWASSEPLLNQMQPLQFAAGVEEPALGAAPGLGRWTVEVVAVVLVSGVFQEMACLSATTVHRPMPVCV